MAKLVPVNVFKKEPRQQLDLLGLTYMADDFDAPLSRELSKKFGYERGAAWSSRVGVTRIGVSFAKLPPLTDRGRANETKMSRRGSVVVRCSVYSACRQHLRCVQGQGL